MGYILILGAGTETGKILANKYASKGYDLYLADKTTEELETTKESINEEYGVDVQTLKFDVTEFYNHRNLYMSLNPEPGGVICAIDYKGDPKRAQR